MLNTFLPASTKWHALSLSTIAIAGALSIAPTAEATEGGVGRPITGMQVLPLAGILPNQDGPLLSISSIYYQGSIDRSKSVPIAGKLAAGLDYHISYNLLTGLYVWKSQGRWTYGSSVSLPIQYTDIKATLSGPNNTFRKQDTSTQMADIMVSPIMADYHFSETSHMLFNVQVFAPTGSYDSNRLANAGQNTWTFIPNVAYTTIIPKHNIELTAVVGAEFYTRNKDTDYTNGTIGRIDALAIKRFGNGWGVGLNAGIIQQLEDDKGALADALGGNKGRSMGLGPVITYEKKIGKTSLSTSLRWVNEFNVSNRPEGNATQLSVTAQF